MNDRIILIGKTKFYRQEDGSYSALASRIRPAESKYPQILPLDQGKGIEVRGMGSSSQRHRVTITMHRLKMLDEDNRRFAPKSLTDGFVAASIIQGDSEREIESDVQQVQVTERNQIGTMIEIGEI